VIALLGLAANAHFDPTGVERLWVSLTCHNDSRVAKHHHHREQGNEAKPRRLKKTRHYHFYSRQSARHSVTKITDDFFS
jgi:hypothetical protein